MHKYTALSFFLLLAILFTAPFGRVEANGNPGSPWLAASGATFTVTKTADTNDGACDDDCSLREAVIAANALPGADTIQLPAGIYRLKIAGAGEDAASKGDLDLKDPVIIQGEGATTTIVDGGWLDRVFHIPVSVDVTFTGFTIRHGMTGEPGGGVYMNDNPAFSGTVTFEGMVVTENRSSNGGGISIPNGGQLNIENSTVSQNLTAGSGGGIQLYASSLSAKNSTISGNTTSSGGGGGGIYNYGDPGNPQTLTLNNVTIAMNISTTGIGGGIANYLSPMTISNSIISNNHGGDCTGMNITSTGYNIIPDLGCSISGNVTSLDPMLGPLQNNGGLTPTHVLLPGSPALEAGSPASPGSGGSACQPTDQRGITRPQGARCDMGAYELTPGGTIGGVVYNMVDQVPMPGVTVRLDYDHFGGSPSYSAVSDAYGAVSFMNIAPGKYSFLPFPPSGWIGSGKIINVVPSDQSTYMLALIKDISLLFPEDNSSVETPNPRLCWENLPRVVSYTLRISSPGGALIENPTVYGACYTVTTPLKDSNTYTWSIANALDNSGQSLGGSQDFRLTYHGGPVTEPIQQGAVTSLTSWDQGTAVDFPAGSLSGPGTVTYQPVIQPPSAYPLAGIQETFKVNSTAPLAPGASFQVSVTYNEDAGLAVEPSTLALYAWDPALKRWVKEPTSQVDITSNTLTASPSHFATWAVLGKTNRYFVPLMLR